MDAIVHADGDHSATRVVLRGGMKKPVLPTTSAGAHPGGSDASDSGDDVDDDEDDDAVVNSGAVDDGE